MPPSADDDVISLRYYARQQCSRQWLPLMASMFAEFEEKVASNDADRFLAALGERMAKFLPLRRCESLEELETGINAVFGEIDWGWVRVAEGSQFIEILHGAYPQVPQDEARRSWLVPVLEAIFTVWLAQQGGAESHAARLAAPAEAPGAPLLFRYGPHHRDGGTVDG
jgi:hypothetical protein